MDDDCCGRSITIWWLSDGKPVCLIPADRSNGPMEVVVSTFPEPQNPKLPARSRQAISSLRYWSAINPPWIALDSMS